MTYAELMDINEKRVSLKLQKLENKNRRKGICEPSPPATTRTDSLGLGKEQEIPENRPDMVIIPSDERGLGF